MNKIPIFLATDDNYMSYTASTMASILHNTKRFISFFIMADETVSHSNKKLIMEFASKYDNCSVEFIDMDTEKHFGRFDGKRYTLNTFSRILIPQLKPELGKVLYLDVDLIVMDDIAKLYDIDLGGTGAGAICDYSLQIDTRLTKVLHLPRPKDYFNAGVMLMDCDWWRKHNTTEALFDLADKWEGITTMPDQDILNIYFQEHGFKMIPLRFNYKFGIAKQEPEVKKAYGIDDKFILNEYRNCVIRHWAWVKKPWLGYYNPYTHFDDFWMYMKMTPFYPGELAKFIAQQHKASKDNSKRTWIRVFGIPLVRIKRNKAYLFGLIPVVSVK